MKATVIAITPNYAEKLLKLNTNNRALNNSTVQKYASEMKAGNWKSNGDTITISKDRLIDGQHRLKACVESNTPFETILVEGVVNDVFDTKDVGKRRSISDILSIAGERYTIPLAASINKCIAYEDYANGKYTINANRVKTAIEIEQWLEANPRIRNSVELLYKDSKYQISPINRTLLIATHYLACERGNCEAADEFVYKCATGVHIGEDDPIFKLRVAVTAEVKLSRRMNVYDQWGMLIKTWNAYINNKKIKRLYFNVTRDKFPLIH